MCNAAHTPALHTIVLPNRHTHYEAIIVVRVRVELALFRKVTVVI